MSEQKRIETNKEYSIKGEYLVNIVDILQNLPRRFDQIGKNIEALISTVTEIVTEQPKDTEDAVDSQ